MRNNDKLDEADLKGDKEKDKKIIEYALYMEKQYKILEEKLKKKNKLINEISKDDNNQDKNILV